MLPDNSLFKNLCKELTLINFSKLNDDDFLQLWSSVTYAYTKLQYELERRKEVSDESEV